MNRNEILTRLKEDPKYTFANGFLMHSIVDDTLKLTSNTSYFAQRAIGTLGGNGTAKQVIKVLKAVKAFNDAAVAFTNDPNTITDRLYSEATYNLIKAIRSTK